VVDVFSAATLFVFGSLSETQGMVVLEALSLGTPCVVIDTLGPGELLRGEEGGLFALPDPADMAEKMVTLCGDGALRARKSEQGRARAHEYDAGLLAGRLHALYAGAVEEHATGVAKHTGGT
jgi:glycosyltransferase involved in cell wall biosynthesis